jgi:hypothetical protein
MLALAVVAAAEANVSMHVILGFYVRLLHCPTQGLSEPLGALGALATMRTFVTPERLHYGLAAVGGLMVSSKCASRMLRGCLGSPLFAIAFGHH